MSVDVEKLSMTDFLALLRYEGKPPAGPEFDAIRMTPQEWTALFPGAAQHDQPPEEPPEGGQTSAQHPRPAATAH
jgi:hypothetical protein